MTSNPPGIDTTAVQSKTLLLDTSGALVAQPSRGYALESWVGAPAPCTGLTCSFTLSEPTEIQAIFVPVAEAFEGAYDATGTQSRDFGPPIGLCTWTTTLAGIVTLTLTSPDAGVLNVEVTQTDVSDQPPTQCADSVREHAFEFGVAIVGTSITGSTIFGDSDVDFEGTRAGDSIDGTLAFTLRPPFTGSIVGDVVLDRLP